MLRLAPLRAFALLLLPLTLAACDTNDGSGGGSAYFGTYTGNLTGTATVSGIPVPINQPGTATFAKTGTGTASLAVGFAGNTVSLTGIYNDSGMVLTSEQGARVEIDKNGKIVGTMALPVGPVSLTLTAAGTITARRLTMQFTAPPGSPVAATATFEGTK